METRYKFLRLNDDNEIRSENGDCTWTIGEWQSVGEDEEVEICETGFHCSQKIYQAFTYVQGEILALVEVEGDSVINDDKEAWERMRLVKCWHWRKQDSVALSIHVSSLILENFEKVYPEDDRPRKAIEAAKRVLEEDNEENRSAAWSAAWSAARSAAQAAWSAAEAAAEAARSAAWSAEAAAWSAAWSAEEAKANLVEQIATWMDGRLLVLVEYVPVLEEKR